MDVLVSTEWLADNLGTPGLRILDATAFLPGTPRDAAAEYAEGHIPGARLLDIATLINADDPTPGMLPSDAQATARLQALGIGQGDRIILYDDSPIHPAARAWWMFHMFGFDAAILDGGLGKWRAESRPVEGGALAITPSDITVTADRASVRTKADILANIVSGALPMVDARGAGRFTGAEKEPREGMASGHIPGSRNLPYAALYKDDGTFKQGEELRAAFVAAGVDPDQPMITTCGSGVTAAIVMVGAHLLGNHDVALYDGSWSEWGFDPATPKATGPA